MIVGIPAEIKDNEYRVAATPEGVTELARAGHTVLVERGAGSGSAIADADFVAAGATIVTGASDVWSGADMVLKVKEPIEVEFPHLREGLILFTYLHLAAARPLTEALVAAGTSAVAYETIQDPQGRLPLLAPMSEIAGRMAPHVAANLLEKERGGRGVLMGGSAGVAPAKVLVLGAGMAGTNAAWIAAGMEAEVVIVDKSADRLRFVDEIHRGRIQTLMVSSLALERLLPTTDVVIGSVLVPGAKAPRLVTREMVASMRQGSVVVDVSVDQGGCVETTRVTTHSDPTYVEEGVVHYCVGNMPGAVPNTSTYALTNATLPFAHKIADMGLEEAASSDPAIATGMNVVRGAVVNPAVAEAHGMSGTTLRDLGFGVGTDS
jgi:alanine dehydrogenase